MLKHYLLKIAIPFTFLTGFISSPVLSFEAADRQSQNLSFSGIVPEIEDDLYPNIKQVLAGSSADEAGISPGLKLVSINGRNAAFMGIDELTAALRGRKGEKLRVEVGLGAVRRSTVLSLSPLPEKQAVFYQLLSRTCYPVHKEILQSGCYSIDLPSFMRSEASEGAEVIEFYKGGGESKLLPVVAHFNAVQLKEAEKGMGPKTPLVQLVRLNIDDPELAPLVEHFRIKSCPSYIFLASPAPTIKDYIDVVRHDLSREELEEKLQELLLAREKGPDFLPFIQPGLFAKWAKITNREVQQEWPK